jgi:membrane fusion protein (multidrug efflux system)
MILISRVCVFSLGLALIGLTGCSGEAPSSTALPPPVVVAPVIQKTVEIYGEYVGQTESPRDVELRARVEGFLTKITFKEGSRVNKGDLLFVIDPRQYLADYHRAQAKLARDKAALLKARQDAKRYRSLHKKEAVSTSRLELAVTRSIEAEAVVADAVQVLKQAELNLSFTKIYAPLSGRIGRAVVKIGSLVGKGEPTLLATISQIDPIYVNISISEREALIAQKETRKRAKEGKKDPEGRLTLILADDSIYPHEGTINFIDRKVDQRTSTLPVRLEFPNSDNLLRPGQFARIRAILERREDALLVPQRAVQEGMEGQSVFVVTANHTVEMRRVVAGSRHGSQWVIEQGLQPGEQVIVEGIQKVRPGLIVEPTTESSPAEVKSPTPTNTLGSGKGVHKNQES